MVVKVRLESFSRVNDFKSALEYYEYVRGLFSLVVHNIVEQVALGYVSRHELLALVVRESIEVWNRAEKLSFQINLLHFHLSDQPLVILFIEDGEMAFGKALYRGIAGLIIHKRMLTKTCPCSEDSSLN